MYYIAKIYVGGISYSFKMYSFGNADELPPTPNFGKTRSGDFYNYNTQEKLVTLHLNLQNVPKADFDSFLTSFETSPNDLTLEVYKDENTVIYRYVGTIITPVMQIKHEKTVVDNGYTKYFVGFQLQFKGVKTNV